MLPGSAEEKLTKVLLKSIRALQQTLDGQVYPNPYFPYGARQSNHRYFIWSNTSTHGADLTGLFPNYHVLLCFSS